jgi:hypothetical protein
MPFLLTSCSATLARTDAGLSQVSRRSSRYAGPSHVDSFSLRTESRFRRNGSLVALNKTIRKERLRSVRVKRARTIAEV